MRGGHEMQRVYASRAADFKSPTRRYSSFLLLLAIGSLLIACGGGGGGGGGGDGGDGGGGGGGAPACVTGPNPTVLEWDPVSDPNPVRYRIYYGTSSLTYSQREDVGNNTTFTVTELSSGRTYYFAATAYTGLNDESVESVISNEVCKTITASD
jgi:hypothetical protein